LELWAKWIKYYLLTFSLTYLCADAAPNGDVSVDDTRHTDVATTSPRLLSDAEGENDDDDELAGARRRRRGGVSNNNWKADDDTDDEPKDTYKYQRRRSRAVLYQLSGSYGGQRSTKGKLQLTKVRGYQRQKRHPTGAGGV